MKAIVYTQYGSPDVLHLTEIEKPTPKDDELLIKVHAASVNAADWHMMRATPFLARLDGGLLKPKSTILGMDIAGRVEAVGSSIKEFQPGDAVFGDAFPGRGGGFAEYICVPEHAVVLKPDNVTFEQAAAVPLAAITALQGLRDTGHIQAGQKVLVNGASGGVGSFAVQIAKSFGAEVTGVCSTSKLDMVRSIGADHVIDYTQEDFTRNGQQYDLIYDAVGNYSISDYQRALKPNGIAAVAGFTTLSRLFQLMLLGPWVSKRGSQKIGLTGTSKANKKDLGVLKQLLETGKIVPVIDRRYPLSEVPEAVGYVEKGHARGKVVITIHQD
jgi:NADPH:quinone reductase-like Zn-dependent oxidoreductase